MSDPILEVRGITKVYPNGVVANRDVTFSVERGSVHAVVGENGAGKSTLMNILFGIERAQGGDILFKGEPLRISRADEAIKVGIGMVHQHFMLAPDLTVAQNIVLGQEPSRGLLFDEKRANAMVDELSARFELRVPSDKKVRELPVGQRQRVEILKALFRKSDLFILDEPTAVLTPQETDELFATLRKLRASGITILFISHKLKEVKAISDRVTVMRQGRVVTTREAAELSEHEIAQLMVGRELSFDRLPAFEPGAAVLRVRDLSYAGADGVKALDRVSFDIRSGEILGVAGVDGNGQAELAQIIAGLKDPDSGSLDLEASSLLGASIAERRRRGLAYVPDDRLRDGLAAGETIEDNLIVSSYGAPPFSRGALIDYRQVRRHAEGVMARFGIVAKDAATTVDSLSGGNMQKVVIGRELSAVPRVVVFNQPSRGVDVGSMDLIHDLIRRQRDEGCAILLISADIDEVIMLSTRILVLYGGTITARFPDTAGISPADLGPYMLGAKRQEPAE
jgi:simple sugar transport system ATP-binding protein